MFFINMKIQKNYNSLNFTSRRCGASRFLYHLTTKENYKNILETGALNPSFKEPNGVYLLELPNFLKNWYKSPAWNFACADLRLFLINKISKRSKNLVLLRISTKELPFLDKTRIRSQQRLLSFDFYDEEKMVISNPDYRHVSMGDSVNRAPLYKQRKEAIEYIYPDKIPLSAIKKIGETPIWGLTYNKETTEKIMWNLLKNQPEMRLLKVIKKGV